MKLRKGRIWIVEIEFLSQLQCIRYMTRKQSCGLSGPSVGYFVGMDSGLNWLRIAYSNGLWY